MCLSHINVNYLCHTKLLNYNDKISRKYKRPITRLLKQISFFKIFQQKIIAKVTMCIIVTMVTNLEVRRCTRVDWAWYQTGWRICKIGSEFLDSLFSCNTTFFVPVNLEKYAVFFCVLLFSCHYYQSIKSLGTLRIFGYSFL